MDSGFEIMGSMPVYSRAMAASKRDGKKMDLNASHAEGGKPWKKGEDEDVVEGIPEEEEKGPQVTQGVPVGGWEASMPSNQENTTDWTIRYPIVPKFNRELLAQLEYVAMKKYEYERNGKVNGKGEPMPGPVYDYLTGSAHGIGNDSSMGQKREHYVKPNCEMQQVTYIQVSWVLMWCLTLGD